MVWGFIFSLQTEPISVGQPLWPHRHLLSRKPYLLCKHGVYIWVDSRKKKIEMFTCSASDLEDLFTCIKRRFHCFMPHQVGCQIKRSIWAILSIQFLFLSWFRPFSLPRSSVQELTVFYYSSTLLPETPF